MNGSAPLPATRHERETTAAEICVVIPHEADVRLLVRSLAPEAERPEAPSGAGAVAVVWRRRAGNPVVHAYAANACVDVPLCGSGFKSTPGTTSELPPPPAELGPYRRCRKCMSTVGRFA